MGKRYLGVISTGDDDVTSDDVDTVIPVVVIKGVVHSGPLQKKKSSL